MRAFVIQYRCRRCGGTWDGVGGHRDLIQKVLDDLDLKEISSQPGIPATRQEVHGCSDGSLGVGDVIGAVEMDT